MPKLTLSLEELEVVSFDVAPREEGEARGTVHGRERAPTPACSAIDLCPSRLCTDRC